ncbi:MAG: STAS domain-containing protein [Chloroflexi bacterium]|nr:STAS domain-containing protein [Chloroflexota bacterium]
MSDETRITLTREERPSGLVVVKLSGDLDSYGTKEINNPFAVAVSSDRSLPVVVDLSNVEFMSSAALAMFIVHAQAMTRAGGKLCVANPNEQVETVFTLAGFQQLIPVYDSLDKAISELEAETGTSKDE